MRVTTGSRPPSRVGTRQSSPTRCACPASPALSPPSRQILSPSESKEASSCYGKGDIWALSGAGRFTDADDVVFCRCDALEVIEPGESIEGARARLGAPAVGHPPGGVSNIWRRVRASSPARKGDQNRSRIPVPRAVFHGSKVLVLPRPA